jgi:hypothetical protein
VDDPLADMHCAAPMCMPHLWILVYGCHLVQLGRHKGGPHRLCSRGQSRRPRALQLQVSYLRVNVCGQEGGAAGSEAPLAR